MAEKINGQASADDFRKAAAARHTDRGALERVVLPQSGYAVVLRRPTPMWFLFHGHLPMSLAAKQGAGDRAPGATIETAAEFVEFSKWIVELLGEVFVGPKLSLHPGPDEISPEWLDEDDVNFIIRWAVGEVVTEGGEAGDGASTVRDLGDFRRKKARAAAAPGAGGGDVPLPAQPAPARHDDGPAD